MKLINVSPAARVILIAAIICVSAGSGNAQQIGSAQEGRRLARGVCAECHAIYDRQAARQIPMHLTSRSLPILRE